MTDFDAIRNLIGEINGLCEKVEEENKQLEDKIHEKREYDYFMMCTDLEPFFKLYKDCKIGSIKIVMKRDFSGNIIHSITFTDLKKVYIDNSPINIKDKFMAYECLPDHSKVRIDAVVSLWNTSSSEFEKEFMRQLREQLTLKANKINSRNEELKKKLEG